MNNDTTHEEALLALVKRLAGVHQEIRAEMRFCQAVDLEGVSAMLSLACLPIEEAIVDLGRMAVGKPPLAHVRA